MCANATRRIRFDGPGVSGRSESQTWPTGFTGYEARNETPAHCASLVRFPGVVFFVVDVGMVFQRLQVSSDFSGHPQLGGQALFKNGGQAVSLADWRLAREQQVYFDDLAISGGSEAYAVVLNVQFRANCIQLAANFPAGFRIGIIQ